LGGRSGGRGRPSPTVFEGGWGGWDGRPTHASFGPRFWSARGGRATGRIPFFGASGNQAGPRNPGRQTWPPETFGETPARNQPPAGRPRSPTPPHRDPLETPLGLQFSIFYTGRAAEKPIFFYQPKNPRGRTAFGLHDAAPHGSPRPGAPKGARGRPRREPTPPPPQIEPRKAPTAFFRTHTRRGGRKAGRRGGWGGGGNAAIGRTGGVLLPTGGGAPPGRFGK